MLRARKGKRWRRSTRLRLGKQGGKKVYVRIGNMPIDIPAGVDVTVGEGNFITVKGPLGTLSQQVSPKMIIQKEDSTHQGRSHLL